MIDEKGSFRDPAGKIFYLRDKVYRKINKEGLNRLKYVIENDIISKSVDKKFLIKTKECEKNNHEINISSDELVFEHERVPYISYPYEWSFSQLKTAAIHHIDFHLFLLEMNATLIDASAYNIQFIGFKPIFIDLLSIKQYEQGEYWKGHKQFCENFLNPLLLKSKKGINFNNWFKGNLEGIETGDLNNILNFFDKLSLNVFMQVYLLNKLEERSKLNKDIKVKKKERNFPKKSFISMLHQLRKFISNLNPKKKPSLWEDYSVNNTYKFDEEKKKISCVENFCKKNKFNKFADVGCNNGLYSTLALKNGCNYVVGFDYDINAVDEAFNKSSKEKLNFLPLYFDASNPSSNIGWNENERKSFKERGNFDGIAALAFEHHLSIAKNIPLNEVIDWLISLAPKGLIEFIPKNDETIKKMLEFKGDIFPDYNEENFTKFISNKGKILSCTKISASGRAIYEYER